MKKIKFIIITALVLVLTFLVVQEVQAANIYGNVYDSNLNLLKKAVVEVDSEPKQNMVAADGSYSFDLSPGNYTIEAFYSYQGVLFYTKETTNIPAEGNFVNDLILFSIENIEELGLDEFELALVEDLLSKSERNTRVIILVIFIVIIILAVLIAYLLLKYRKIKKIKKKKKKIQKKKKSRITRIKKLTGDELFDNVLAFIKRERRVTQKDLRMNFNVSEAKMSLILIDLEHQGIVQKIKKGRGNIIIYKG